MTLYNYIKEVQSYLFCSNKSCTDISMEC